jgi:hypothetical protein
MYLACASVCVCVGDCTLRRDFPQRSSLAPPGESPQGTRLPMQSTLVILPRVVPPPKQSTRGVPPSRPHRETPGKSQQGSRPRDYPYRFPPKGAPSNPPGDSHQVRLPQGSLARPTGPTANARSIAQIV